jgi:hypothetical protein
MTSENCSPDQFEYPAVTHLRAMIAAYIAHDSVTYQKEREIVLSCIENIDKMIKSAQARC